MLAAADKRLTEVRRHVPDAGGLVIASNQTEARAYAAILRQLTGEAPTVVLSDDAGASRRIEEFAASDERWMVAVRMVSEGVDVPRLAVGRLCDVDVDAALLRPGGRPVRAGAPARRDGLGLPARRCPSSSTTRAPRGPARPRPRPQAEPRRHRAMWAEEQALSTRPTAPPGQARLDEGAFEALESDAHFDHVLFDGGSSGCTPSRVGGRGGVPRAARPARARPGLRAAAGAAEPAGQEGAEPAEHRPCRRHRALAAQRKELNKLVSAYARKKGLPHANVHTDLRRVCGGPDLAEASSEQVTERIEKIRGWFVGRR